MRLSPLLIVSLLSLAGAACNTDTASGEERGSIGKADLVGSCASACGGQSASGNCFCDDLCSDFGDCCSDFADECALSDCDSCLASGGTWQPEADACTANCDLQDISCFVDSCPGDIDQADDCESCLTAGGTWQPEADACTESCDIQDISCFVDSCP